MYETTATTDPSGLATYRPPGRGRAPAAMADGSIHDCDTGVIELGNVTAPTAADPEPVPADPEPVPADEPADEPAAPGFSAARHGDGPGKHRPLVPNGDESESDIDRHWRHARGMAPEDRAAILAAAAVAVIVGVAGFVAILATMML